MLTIVGCGNSNRSDDGAGVYVAQQLRQDLAARPRADVHVVDAGTGGMDVMFQARGARKLVIVDACRSGSEAGALFTVPGHELAATPAPGYTLHDFRWNHALAAGKMIFRDTFPADVTVYLIEAASVDFGLELSPPVRSAADRLVTTLREVVERYAGDGAGDGEVGVARGSLYLSRETCEARLPGARSVALVEREGRVLIVPLAPDSPGGLLLKVRNAHGDRVVHAQEFFRQHGYAEDFAERRCGLRWDAAAHALVVDGLAKG